MTNKELQTWFEELRQTKDNVFDILMALDNKQEEYKEMELSKILPTVQSAYDYYYSHKNTVEEITKGIMLSDYSNITDSLQIDKLFEQIPEEYQDVFINLINQATASNK